MGVETVTTITCDECGADITNAAAVQLTVQTQTTTPPPELEEGQAQMPSFPVMTSQSVTLCEAHGEAVRAKINKLVPLPA